MPGAEVDIDNTVMGNVYMDPGVMNLSLVRERVINEAGISAKKVQLSPR